MVKQQSDNINFVAVRAFLASYVTFSNPVHADICALWALGTHVFKRFDTFGYLIITASTKRAGKSVLAELLSMVTRDGKIGTSMTASILRRLVARGATLFFDEAESLNSEAASSVREYLNVGYRAGQSVFMPGAGPEDVIEYPAFGPKCFVLIGDPNDTLRDRSIAIEMRRAKAPKIYRRSEAIEHAKTQILGRINEENGDSELTHTIERLVEDYALTYDEAYDFLDSRSAEIWSPIFALAQVLAPTRLQDIIACACDIDSIKQTANTRSFRVIREESEANAADASFTERAMLDLASVLHDGEARLYTEVAIERMKAIPTSPWRTYKGTGLTPVMLSDLLSTLCKTRDVKIKSRTKRGYQRVDILSGLAKVEGK